MARPGRKYCYECWTVRGASTDGVEPMFPMDICSYCAASDDRLTTCDGPTFSWSWMICLRCKVDTIGKGFKLQAALNHSFESKRMMNPATLCQHKCNGNCGYLPCDKLCSKDAYPSIHDCNCGQPWINMRHNFGDKPAELTSQGTVWTFYPPKWCAHWECELPFGHKCKVCCPEAFVQDQDIKRPRAAWDSGAASSSTEPPRILPQ